MPEVLAPWLDPAWQVLLQRHRSGKLPHAVMITGIAGIGKQALATHIAHTLLCELDEGSPCGRCSTCQLIHAQSHPDLKTIEPLEGDAFIKVDAVRELINWLQLTAQYDAYKVAVVNHAHAMNRNAANSLLKTLEEPASRAFLLLLTDAPGSLPATIRSRCQAISLSPGPTDVAVQWLEAQGIEQAATTLSLAGGGPFRALSMAESEFPEQRSRLLKAWSDIVLGKASIARAVESVSDLPTPQCLKCFVSWTCDIVKLNANASAGIRHEPDREALQALSGALRTENWFALYDQMCRLHRIDSTSFKTQAVLEGLFADIRLKQVTD